MRNTQKNFGIFRKILDFYTKNYTLVAISRGFCVDKVMNNEEKAINYFRNNPGTHRTGEILDAGIYNRTLYRLRDRGDIIKVDYGRYRLATEEPIENITFAEIAQRVPKGVFFLISALDFFQIGTQIPVKHWLALPRGACKPKIRNYSIQFSFLTSKTFNAGIEKHNIHGTEILVYNPSKTVADCFKYRNKIGLDVAIEALKESLRSKKATIPEILRYADVCRVKNVIMPYIEGVL